MYAIIEPIPEPIPESIFVPKVLWHIADNGYKRCYDNPAFFGPGFAEGMAQIDSWLLEYLEARSWEDRDSERLHKLLANLSSTDHFQKMARPFIHSRLEQLPRLKRNGSIRIYVEIESILNKFAADHTAKWMEAEQKLDERTKRAYVSAAMGLMCDDPRQ